MQFITQSNWGIGGNSYDNAKNKSCKAINLRNCEVPTLMNVDQHKTQTSLLEMVIANSIFKN